MNRYILIYSTKERFLRFEKSRKSWDRYIESQWLSANAKIGDIVEIKIPYEYRHNKDTKKWPTNGYVIADIWDEEDRHHVLVYYDPLALLKFS